MGRRGRELGFGCGKCLGRRLGRELVSVLRCSVGRIVRRGYWCLGWELRLWCEQLSWLMLMLSAQVQVQM